jgi:uncharacterized membrane protein
MTLAPLLDASLPIRVHAFVALAALAIGIGQFALVKGSPTHRAIGWLWLALMVLVAASSFFINEMRWFGPFGPIHFVSLYTLVVLPGAVLAARRHDLPAHRRAMTRLFAFALVGAGLFTLWPGRIMNAVVFGH